MKKTKETGIKKALIVTDKQLNVIREACELYGIAPLYKFL